MFFPSFDMEMIEAAQKVWDILMRMSESRFWFLVIGGLDYLYCRREYLQSLL